jgi:ubiquitin carboxyl-terminal hydrolase 14
VLTSPPVIIKHQGKRHEVELDPSATGEILKYQIFSLTGVEPERQKILVKGGQLKDDTDLSTLGAKPGQTFMMLGTPSTGASTVELGKPKEKMKFVEDMTEAEAAKIEGATPAGLTNLGNTCYMNSTLQALKSLPELQEELLKYTPTSGAGESSSSGVNALNQFGLGGLGAQMDLTASLRDLFRDMSETQTGFSPIMFLNALRSAFPQFAQRSKTGQGYAQQDAEEAWSQIVSQLRQKLKIKDTPEDSSSEAQKEVSFIDRYMSGTLDSVLECDEQAAKDAEEPLITSDVFLKLDCHIGKDTNHMSDGIMAGLEEQIEKRSPTLERDTTYTKRSRISRLPKYLTVHFVRFFWKREAQKKAKIMRKVTFPPEFDVVDFCTEELKKKLVPVRNKVRDVRKEEQDVERARKRQKIAHKQEEDRKADAAAGLAPAPEPMEKKEKKKDAESKADGKSEDTDMPDAVFKTDAEYEAERDASIIAAKKELFALIDPELAADEGANKSGLYELRGVITHQGASADSGHYTSYVKKQGRLVDDGKGGKIREDDGKWWWFNDDRVTEVEPEKIETLAGGGMCSHFAIPLKRPLTSRRRESFCTHPPLSSYRLADCGGAQRLDTATLEGQDSFAYDSIASVM